jgi:hypothetical protein
LVQEFHTLMSNSKIEWPILQLPVYRGDVTIEMVLKENEGENRNQMIKSWCESIWKAYFEIHPKIKEIAQIYFK